MSVSQVYGVKLTVTSKLKKRVSGRQTSAVVAIAGTAMELLAGISNLWSNPDPVQSFGDVGMEMPWFEAKMTEITPHKLHELFRESYSY